ncbi:unnamed protein product, partial [Cladocopium goreaui]
HPGRMSWTKLQQLGGAASIRLSDPLGRTGPDSFYAVSKVFGEALGYLFSRVWMLRDVHQSFEFVALRIGWCLYEKPTDLKGDECEDYLRCMFLSQRDFKGFLRAALQRDLARHQGFLIAYAVSRNGLRSFDLQETIETLGYHPVDDAEDYYTEVKKFRRGMTTHVMIAQSHRNTQRSRLPLSAAMAGPVPWRGRYVETPCGRWGICCKETVDELEVLLDSDLSIASDAQSESTVATVALRPEEVRRSSWCALGTCVLSSFGPGVVLRYRVEDDMHEVQLWGPLSQGQNRAFLRREALQEVLPALPGLAVETSSGSGICQTVEPERISVKLTEAGEVVWMSAKDVQCPVAKTLPLVNRFLDVAATMVKFHSGMLLRLADAFQGLGLERLQDLLLSRASEAAGTALQLWDDFEAKEAKELAESLKSQADAAMPKLQGLVSSLFSGLNQLISRALFDGVWIGKDDLEARCTIKDAMLQWHWGEESDFSIQCMWSETSISTLLAGEIFKGSLRLDGCLQWSDGDVWQRRDGEEETEEIAMDLRSLHFRLVTFREMVASGDFSGLEVDGLEDAVRCLSKIAQTASADEDVKVLASNLQEQMERCKSAGYTVGRQVQQLVCDTLPAKAGTAISLASDTSKLLLQQTLLRQTAGNEGLVTFSCTFVPMALYAAWRLLDARRHIDGALAEQEEMALQGLVQMKGVESSIILQLPPSLRRFTGGFGRQDAVLPSKLESLSLADLNQSLKVISLPQALRDLTLGAHFNQSLVGVKFPSSLESLTFGMWFNQSLEGVNLPCNLLKLTFGESFDQSLQGVKLPESLQKLTFGRHFNQTLEAVTLPAALEDLTFGGHFDQTMQGVNLPQSLQSLTFGDTFAQSMDQVTLPCGLQGLHFGDWFDQSRGMNLPSNLRSLTLGGRGSSVLKQLKLPSTLQSLTLGKGFNEGLKGLPENLQSLTFGTQFNQSLEGLKLPKLQSLTFGNNYRQTLEGVELPESLQSLTFGRYWSHSLEHMVWPRGLQQLTFGERFGCRLDCVRFPSSLQSLTLGDYNLRLPSGILPDGLQYLRFGSMFNSSLEYAELPESLQTLIFGRSFNESLEKVKLPSLRTLVFGDGFNQSLEKVEFPSLENLTLPAGYNHSLDCVNFPAGAVLLQGQKRLAEQLTQLQETAITPQLDAVQKRSQRFLTHLATDDKVKSKASQLFSAVEQRFAEQLPNQLEEWVQNLRSQVRDQLGLNRALLVDGLKALPVNQEALREILLASWDHTAKLEAQLESCILDALNASGVDCTGTELVNCFESSTAFSNIPALRQSSGSLLTLLKDLNIEVPSAVQNLLEAHAAGRSQDANAWKAALKSSLDDEVMVKGATGIVEHGERVMAKLQELKENQAVARVVEQLEKNEDMDIEREVMNRIHDFNPEQALSKAEEAWSNIEAREELVNHLKDTCLDFILKILPAIQIEKVNGQDNDCDWEISPLDFDFGSWMLAQVRVALNDLNASEEVLRISAWGISAHFYGLKVYVCPTSLIAAECTGDAIAEGMSLDLAFRWQRPPADSPDGTLPQLVMCSRKIEMASLDLWVHQTDWSLSTIVNALTFLFADVLKRYACEKIASKLDEHMGVLVEGLNSSLVSCAPLLKRLGFSDLLDLGQEEPSQEPSIAIDPKIQDARQTGFWRQDSWFNSMRQDPNDLYRNPLDCLG